MLAGVVLLLGKRLRHRQKWRAAKALPGLVRR
jgi:hypothetical protein